MTEPDLGPLFRQSTVPQGQLDAETIIKRSRRRRLPRLVSAGAVPVVAMIGILGGGVYGLAQLGGSSGAASSASGSVAGPVTAPVPAHGGFAPGEIGKSDQSTTGGASCAIPMPYFGPTATDLTATAEFPANATTNARGVVIVTNTGSKHVVGTSGSPYITVEAGGTIIALSLSSDSAARVIDLQPGASTKLTAYLPARCSRAAGEALTGPFKVEASLNLILGGGTHEVVRGKATALSMQQ